MATTSLNGCMRNMIQMLWYRWGLPSQKQSCASTASTRTTLPAASRTPRGNVDQNCPETALQRTYGAAGAQTARKSRIWNNCLIQMRVNDLSLKDYRLIAHCSRAARCTQILLTKNSTSDRCSSCRCICTFFTHRHVHEMMPSYHTPQESVPLHQNWVARRCGWMYTPLPEDSNHETNSGAQTELILFGFVNCTLMNGFSSNDTSARAGICCPQNTSSPWPQLLQNDEWHINNLNAYE